MDKLILCVIKLKLKAACSDVSLLIPISFQLTVEPAEEHIAANIEFTAIVEKWSVNIFLDDKGLFSVILSTNLALDV